MCTVTYLPFSEGFILTSSRDEKIGRKPAKFPFQSNCNEFTLLYPKDGQANGTWVCGTSNGFVGCLLNGAFEKHESTPPYGKSRGQIVLDIMSQEYPFIYLQSIDLQGIEPFTFILINKEKLSENRWDGNKLHCKALNNVKKHIWSSCTLYSDIITKEREVLFSNYSWERITPAEAIDFHLNAFKSLGVENQAHMLRPATGYRTVSITSVKSTTNETAINYHDLVDGTISEESVNID
ncbi:MAG: NRDE family protein [Cyclobacteriaceae bacterium]